LEGTRQSRALSKDQAKCFKNTLVLPQRVETNSVSGLTLLFEEPCPLGLQTVFSSIQPDPYKFMKNVQSYAGDEKGVEGMA
jgi:hypothetical protein